MGQINLIHDESWRAARLVVNYFHARLDDDEMAECVQDVCKIVSESMKRLWERHERELHRLAKLKLKHHE